MSDFTELIMSRRSVRKYKEEQIPEESLQAILKAGIYAPNGGNTQMWHFTVLQKQNTLKELNELIRKAFAKNADSDNRFIKGAAKVAQSDMYCFYYRAPTLILVSSDVANPNAIADCACAVENILLAAHAEGIGSVYINAPTWFDDDPGVRALLTKIGLPQNYHVCASAAIGYSDAPPAKGIRNEDVVNYVR
ncbi:MAG: nitroreductase family protein [Halobacteriota archaeon]|jgi:nitroreductase